MAWCLGVGIFFTPSKRKFAKCATGFVMFVRLSAYNNSRTAVRVLSKCDVDTLQFLLKSETKINESLHSFLASTREIAEYLLKQKMFLTEVVEKN
jgi:hypothetical protein